MGLTDLAVKNAQAGTTRREIADGNQIYLVVQPSGAKSFALRYRFEGVPRKYTLGRYPEVSLKEARRRAEIARGKIAAGIDPGAEKTEAREARKKAAKAEKNSVETVVFEFIERYAKRQTRETSWKETERILRREVVPVWGRKSLAEIGRRDVHDLLDKIVDRPAPILANRVLATVRKMCNWAVERGIIEASPCDKIKPPSGEKSRDRVLTDEELKAIWKAACADGWPFGNILQLLILTGQRRDEVGQMCWSEIDFAEGMWTIPKERVKNGTEHLVPLSNQAVAILKDTPHLLGARNYIFTSTGNSPFSGFSKAKRRVENLVAAQFGSRQQRWTLHDIRRTVASGMAGIGVQLPVIEKVLNHTSGSFGGIAGVYQRHTFREEKRSALLLWGRHIERLVTEDANQSDLPNRKEAQ